MRAFTPGGRFTTDFELNEVGDGITWDVTNPFGTHAELWEYDKAASVADPIYDVEPVGTGRVWKGPYTLHVVSASLKQGSVPMNPRGFYSADTLKLTVNIDDMFETVPELFNERGKAKSKISDANRYRVIWQEQVYRPVTTKLEGYVDDRGTIIVLDCIQVMPEEMVNDVQFLQYAQI